MAKILLKDSEEYKSCILLDNLVTIEYFTSFSAEQIMAHLHGRYNQVFKNDYVMVGSEDPSGYVKLAIFLMDETDEDSVWNIAKEGLFAIDA